MIRAARAGLKKSIESIECKLKEIIATPVLYTIKYDHGAALIFAMNPERAMWRGLVTSSFYALMLTGTFSTLKKAHTSVTSVSAANVPLCDSRSDPYAARAGTRLIKSDMVSPDRTCGVRR